MQFKIMFVPVLALIWAGVSLGGSLVAAPAKFTAPSLEMSVALDVGRAQFKWLGHTEAALLILMIVALVFTCRHLDWRLFLIPVAAFLIQQLGVMPKLDAVTIEAIEGAAETSGGLHVTYVVLEFVKFASLIVASVFCLYRMI